MIETAMASVLRLVIACIALVTTVHGTVVKREVLTPSHPTPLTRNVTLDDRNNCQPGDPQPPNRVDTAERVARLRQEMANNGLNAFIVPTDDDHQSEYVGESDKRRKYISGFSGSAGTAVVLMEEQALWTDGRYFLQADDQLDCNWLLMKAYMSGTPTILQWLKDSLPSGARVGADPTLTSADTWLSYANSLAADNIDLVPVTPNLVDLIWTDRPPYPSDPAFPLELKFTGKSWEEKVLEVRDEMRSTGTDVLVASALDEVAWLLNLRGSDIPFNPVFRSYALVTMNSVELFTPAEKVSAEVEEHLHVNQCEAMMCVTIQNYDDIFPRLSSFEDDPLVSKIRISSSYSFTSGASYAIYNAVPASKRDQAASPILFMKGRKNEVESQGMMNAHLKDAVALCDFLALLENEVPASKRDQAASPILFMKGRKNEVESQGMMNAHLKDAVALCDFLALLENEVIAGTYWDELSAVAKSEEFRSQQQDYLSLSFETISASGPNAALIHYSPSPETNRQIDDQSTYLLDSGAQYKDGTTDVTRTLHFGVPTSFQIEAYTRVLMGAMDFASMVFPVGFSLGDIDILARRPLYEAGLDYRHGTSHGIGMCLFVHESANTAYEINFFGSDEPGYYEDGEFGIRLETTLKVVHKETPHDFVSPVLGFEPVALVPFEPKLINTTLLSRQQCEALNAYHATVRDVVGNELKNQERFEGYDWVIRKTEPLLC
ncbi:xaa-Pro aminopeptidase 1-like [Penaeus indicus]|uniref:xaa-Pro aminopeptidase 1-like n=1 Tax=Penaeus indicus TaxID=29960 RepID=UPI00300D18C7